MTNFPKRPRQLIDVDDAAVVELLARVLDQLVTLLVEVRSRRHRHRRVDVDSAIKDAMADIGRQLATLLSYNTLHDLIERIAGDPNRVDWGQRFTPMANALNDAITADGERWIT